MNVNKRLPLFMMAISIFFSGSQQAAGFLQREIQGRPCPEAGAEKKKASVMGLDGYN